MRLSNKSSQLAEFCIVVVFTILTVSCGGLPNDTKAAIVSHIQNELEDSGMWVCFGTDPGCPPKLCERGCDEIKVTRAESVEVSGAEQANGIQRIWCADIELIAMDKNGLWKDEKVSYRAIYHSSGSVELEARTYKCY